MITAAVLGINIMGCATNKLAAVQVVLSCRSSCDIFCTDSGGCMLF